MSPTHPAAAIAACLPAGPDPHVLADIAAGLPDPVLLVGDGAVALWANRSAERFFGLTLDDAAGISGLDLIHPDDLQIAILALTSVQAKEVGTPLEVRLRAHDGWRLTEVIGAPIGDQLVLSIRDLTERRRWEVAHDEDARFRSIVHNASMLTMLLASDGTVVASSAVLSRVLGHDQEWLEGRSFADIVSERSRSTLHRTLADVLSPGEAHVRTITVDLDLVTIDERPIPFALTINNLLDDPTVGALVVSGHDITDRKAAEDALRTANSVLSATLESTADGVLVVDNDQRITRVNQRFIDMWAIPLEVIEGRDDEEALGVAVQQLRDPEAFVAKVQELYRHPDSESHDTIELLDGRVFERDSLPQRIDGRVVGRVWSFRDVTDHRVLQEELTRQAFHDALTGLANQALFRDRVDHAVARLDRTGSQLAVIFIDLDDFKTVNDSLGHTVGDELLIAVSDRLSRDLRASDTAARLGGDEFAVLIEDLADEADAINVAERIVASLREPVTLASKPVSVTASVGIAFARAGGGLDGDALLRNADLAMYTAKARGKSCYRVFAPEMHHAAVERLEIESSLRGAATRGELIVHYQPIYDLATRLIRGAEALVRWQHPERGLLGPGAFIALAEESDLIDEIGEHVLVAALAEARRWRVATGEERAPAINVNLSPRQLLDSTLPERISAMVRRFGLRPDLLVLEITEGALMADPEAAARNLQGLSNAGIRLAVDDFGTGYSSLAYLQRFPIDFLKVDGSFVAEMGKQPGAGMVGAIVQLAHNLGLTPIAEGVETAEQAAELERLGCDLGQGYHLDRPLDAGTIHRLITDTLVTDEGETRPGE